MILEKIWIKEAIGQPAMRAELQAEDGAITKTILGFQCLIGWRVESAIEYLKSHKIIVTDRFTIDLNQQKTEAHQSQP